MSENSAAAALSAPPAAAPAADAGAAPATPPAGSGAASPAASAPAGGAANEGKWWGTFADETTRGYAETKNFATPEDAVRSYQNLEKLLGSKANAVMIPGAEATDEERAAFFNKLGRPGAPENYAVPDALKEDATIKGFAAEAHKLGMTSTQFEGVMKFVAEQQTAMSTNTDAKFDADSKAEMDALRRDNPGLKYDQLLENGRRGMRELDLNGDDLSKLERAMGTRWIMEFTSRVGSKFGEAPFVEGQPRAGAPSPEAARLEHASLSKDKAFMQKWLSGDTDAVARINKLNVAMSGGKQ